MAMVTLGDAEGSVTVSVSTALLQAVMDMESSPEQVKCVQHEMSDALTFLMVRLSFNRESGCLEADGLALATPQDKQLIVA